MGPEGMGERMLWYGWVEWAFGILTALAVGFAVMQLMFHSRQMHRDFEVLYVQRYWALMDKRSTEFSVDGIRQPADKPVLHAYFQLCEDEIDLRRAGRITDSTWAQWGPWMLEQCRAPGYAETLADASSDSWPSLRRALDIGPTHDPISLSKARRRWRGL